MTPKYNPRARWYLYGLLISLPWIAMGMPRFSSDFLNFVILGSIGYVLSAATKQRDLGADTGLWPLISGVALALACLAVGTPETDAGVLNKLWILAAAITGFGIAQVVHGFVRRRRQPS